VARPPFRYAASITLAEHSDCTVTISPDRFEAIFPTAYEIRSGTLRTGYDGRCVAHGLDIPRMRRSFHVRLAAPRATLGDGAIKVTDWVQVIGMVSGLESATLSGWRPTNAE